MNRRRDPETGRFLPKAGVLLEESGSAPPADGLVLKEAGPIQAIEKVSTSQNTKRQIKLIAEGWGSSGYYPREVLERDGPKVWPKGTHMYMNHPSLTEEVEQPERRIEDLAAVTTSDPTYRDGGLWSECEIFAHHAEVINNIADHIGVSIRAYGEAESGKRDGHEGPIVEKLTEGISADFVTTPGAGGQIGMLIESARSKALIARMEEDDWQPSEKLRELLLEEARQYFAEPYSVRPKGSQYCVIKTSDGEEMGCHESREKALEQQRALYANESRHSGGKPTKEARMGLEEELSEVRKTVGEHETKITELTEARDNEKLRGDRAEDALIVSEAKRITGDILAGEIEVKEGEDALPELPERARARVIEHATKDIPLAEKEEGKPPKVDEDKLHEKVVKAIRDEAEYLGGSSDAGRVRGMGVSESSNGNGGGEPSELSEKDEEELAEGFQAIGLSESAAKTAVKGR